MTDCHQVQYLSSASVTKQYADADADEFIKLVARGLNRYNIIKRETCIQLKNITIRLTEKEHN